LAIDTVFVKINGMPNMRLYSKKCEREGLTCTLPIPKFHKCKDNSLVMPSNKTIGT